jgi:hypothetical protein
MRAGEPRVLHWLDSEIPGDGIRRTGNRVSPLRRGLRCVAAPMIRA